MAGVFPLAGRAVPQDFHIALPLGYPLGQPCHPLENPFNPCSFTWINPLHYRVEMSKVAQIFVCD